MTSKSTYSILMRASLAEESEKAVASRYFDVYDIRSKIPADSIVIGRYSVLPYYKELEEDLNERGSSLINSYRQHLWMADLKNWYASFEGMTPKTWFRLEDVPENEGPFVLKGNTNSKKFQWNTHMFAKNRIEAGQVYSRLSQDGLIGDQDIYVRKYVPLKKLAMGLNGLPISEEYRIFVMDGKVVSGAFYWSSHIDDLAGPVPSFEENVPKSFIDSILKKVGNCARFFVVDVARTESRDWTIVEFNDAQMSGLSENKPEILYAAMSAALGK